MSFLLKWWTTSLVHHKDLIISLLHRFKTWILLMCALGIHYLFVFEHSPSYDSNLRQDHNRPYARKSLMWDLPFWNDESEKYQTTKRESSKISTWSHSNSCLSFIFLPNIETLLLLLLSSPIESKKRFKVRTFLCLNWSQIHGVFYELTFFFFFLVF